MITVLVFRGGDRIAGRPQPVWPSGLIYAKTSVGALSVGRWDGKRCSKHAMLLGAGLGHLVRLVGQLVVILDDWCIA